MKAVSFRPMSAEDKGAVFKLFEECFGHQVDEASWDWKYNKGPYRSGLNLLAEVDGVVSGHYGAYPVRCVTADGNRFWAHQIGDVMISPRFRGIGVGRGSLIAKLTHTFYERYCKEVAFNYGCPSERHARLGRVLLGYEVLDPIMVWEIDLAQWNAPSFIGAKLWGARLFRRLVVGEEPIGEECARLYQRIASHFSIAVEKTEEYLRWRYEKRPGARYSFIGIRMWGRLSLWSVLKESPGGVLEVGDLIFDPQDRYVLALFIDFLRLTFPGRRLRLWCNSHVEPASSLLHSFGFVPSPHPEKIFFTVTLFDHERFSSDVIRRGFFYQLGDFDLF